MAKKKTLKTHVGPRWAKFCGWLLRKMGWESVGGPMAEPKAIVLGVPHTSVRDFIVSYLFYTQFGKVAHIMIKEEFFFWPLGPILRWCGAVPVEQKTASTTVRSLISLMEDVPEFHLAMAPEGTRALTRRWKNGYHLIAKETGATVYLGYYDWGRKRISVGEPFELSDDPQADMYRIYDHYRPMGIQGYHPEKFAVPDSPKK